MNEKKVTDKRRFIHRKGIWACFAVTVALFGGVTAYQNRPEPVSAVQSVLVFDQGIGMGLDKEDGSLYPMDLLVADRPTGIFLQIDPEVLEKAGTTPSLTITGNGETWKYTGGDYLTEQELLSFADTEAVKWEAGSYHVSVEFDNGGAMEQDICFRDMKNIRVLVVPVSAPYSGKLVKFGELDKTLDDYTRKVYPLGDEDLEWIIYEEGELLLEDPEYDLNSTMGRYHIWKLLDDMYEEGNYDLVLGVVPLNMTPSHEQQASVTGFTFGKAVSAISMEDTSPAVTVAHEIGHCYSLGDEYENGTFSLSSNMVPYGMSGLNTDNLKEKVSGSCPFIKGGTADETQGSGTLVERDNLPYDITTGTLIEQDMTSFMGVSGYSEEEYWITTDIWTTLYRKLAQEEGE